MMAVMARKARLTFYLRKMCSDCSAKNIQGASIERVCVEFQAVLMQNKGFALQTISEKGNPITGQPTC